MPKKALKRRAAIKRPHKAVRSKRHPSSALKLTLRDRKIAIVDMLESIVMNTPDKHREEIAEHICDVGIELMGAVHGADADNAMLIFPDDDIARLIFSIDAHERATGTPCSQIVERLLALISGEARGAYN